MVGLVLVSHSSKIAQGIKAMARQMAPNVLIEAAGGTNDERIGTDVEKISKGIENVFSEDGVLVLFDLGSALMNTEMAVEFLQEEMASKVKIVDCALVEGALAAAVEANIGRTLDEIMESLKELSLGKI